MVTLDADVAETLNRIARERGISFEAALNSAVRAGIQPDLQGGRRYRMPSRALGLRPGTDLTKGLELAYAVEEKKQERAHVNEPGGPTRRRGTGFS